MKILYWILSTTERVESISLILSILEVAWVAYQIVKTNFKLF